MLSYMLIVAVWFVILVIVLILGYFYLRDRKKRRKKDEVNLNKIEEIRRRRKLAHAQLLSLESKVYEKFIQLEEATYADGALKKKDKELIAVGIALATNCESCMEWHISEAVKSGATFREVLEAIEVGIEFGGGKATVSARFALEVMDNISKNAKDKAV
jgi:AhpD family alkylhydroperoxidase